MADNYLTHDGLLFYDAKLRAWILANVTSQPIAIAWDEITGRPSFSTVALSGDYRDLNNLPIVPINISQLTNDRGYQTATEVAGAIASAKLGLFEKVTTLPEIGSASLGTIYLIPASQSTESNIYEEWMVLDGAWEMIGTTSMDLSGYWSKTELTAITNAEIDALFI